MRLGCSVAVNTLGRVVATWMGLSKAVEANALPAYTGRTQVSLPPAMARPVTSAA